MRFGKPFALVLWSIPLSPAILAEPTGAGAQAVAFCGQRLGPATTEVECSQSEPVDLTVLARLPKLDSLSLLGPPVDDLSPLGELEGLTSLYVTDCVAKDLRPLARLRRLEGLTLYGCPARSIRPLAGLVRLRRLRLEDMPVRDLSPLAKLGGLETLSLNRVPARDFRVLARLGNLQWLELQETAFHRPDLLAGLAELYSVNLLGTRIRDVSVFKRLPKLTRVWLPAGVDATPIVDRADLEVLLPVQPTARIAGRLLFDQGRPIEGVQIAISRTDTDCQTRLTGMRTQADGSYLFKQLYPGSYLVEFDYQHAEGGYPLPAHESWAPEPTDQPQDLLDIHMGMPWEASATHWGSETIYFSGSQDLVGQVSGPGGKPVEGARVRIACQRAGKAASRRDHRPARPAGLPDRPAAGCARPAGPRLQPDETLRPGGGPGRAVDPKLADPRSPGPLPDPHPAKRTGQAVLRASRRGLAGRRARGPTGS